MVQPHEFSADGHGRPSSGSEPTRGKIPRKPGVVGRFGRVGSHGKTEGHVCWLRRQRRHGRRGRVRGDERGRASLVGPRLRCHVGDVLSPDRPATSGRRRNPHRFDQRVRSLCLATNTLGRHISIRRCICSHIHYNKYLNFVRSVYRYIISRQFSVTDPGPPDQDAPEAHPGLVDVRFRQRK